MVLLVPSVIKHRLRPGGRALLCCAVREKVSNQPANRLQAVDPSLLHWKMAACHCG